jgi:flagellum-specific ATP synthase
MTQVLGTYRRLLEGIEPIGLAGAVSAVQGLTVSVTGLPAAMGSSCRIMRQSGLLDARVVGFAGGQTLVMPMGSMNGIARGDSVILSPHRHFVQAGIGMLGRVLDAFGRPIDGLGPVRTDSHVPLWPEPISPMQRRRIQTPLPTGVRAIDAMLTVGKGQRMGIFSGSGVGKSMLMGMISRHTTADVAVIALIGERGREVRDFIEKDLGTIGLQRAVVIASTGDEPPLVRVQAAALATAVAEYFRDQGNDVLLLMDSVTRLAAAQRQIGLAAGEPPAAKGYTPSVFNLLPQLLERGGQVSGGSITGFYTVLVEGDDLSEPISDAVRAITDGHIVLSRELANRGHYPAIDVLQSVSRVMTDVTDGEHRLSVREAHRLMVLFSEIEDLVAIGAYRQGANSEYDLAIKAMPLIRGFLAQPTNEPSEFGKTLAALKDLQKQIQNLKQRVSETESGTGSGSKTGSIRHTALQANRGRVALDSQRRRLSARPGLWVNDK